MGYNKVRIIQNALEFAMLKMCKPTFFIVILSLGKRDLGPIIIFSIFCVSLGRIMLKE